MSKVCYKLNLNIGETFLTDRTRTNGDGVCCQTAANSPWQQEAQKRVKVRAAGEWPMYPSMHCPMVQKPCDLSRWQLSRDESFCMTSRLRRTGLL